MKRTAGLHPERQRRTSRRACIENAGVPFARRRAREIRQLPIHIWRGARLRTIRCWGTRGKGPHTVHQPEALLWSLIRIERFVCPFHQPDNADEQGTDAERRAAIGLEATT